MLHRPLITRISIMFKVGCKCRRGQLFFEPGCLLSNQYNTCGCLIAKSDLDRSFTYTRLSISLFSAGVVVDIYLFQTWLSTR